MGFPLHDQLYLQFLLKLDFYIADVYRRNIVDSSASFRVVIKKSKIDIANPENDIITDIDVIVPAFDVFDNIAIGNRLRGDAVDGDRAERLIDQVGLTAHRHKKPNALSGGQRQRVALARTLMEGRPIVLLDEPFSALDAKIRAEMQELAARLFAGKTVCLITHDPGEAARLGDVIFVMNLTGLHSITPPSSPVIRPYDAPDVLACQGQLLRLLRETP